MMCNIFLIILIIISNNDPNTKHNDMSVIIYKNFNFQSK